MTFRLIAFSCGTDFDTFSNAVLVCFQCLTADGWTSLMSEVRQDPTHGKFGVAYFVCFQFMCSSVILNLIVAVILENFTSLGKSNSDLVSRKDIEQFRDTWADFDPHATQRIATAQLPDLLRKLPSPLGLPGAPHLWVARVCLNLGLESHGRKLAFREVLNALVSFNVQQQMRDELPPPGGEIEKSFKVRRAAEAHESSNQSFSLGTGEERWVRREMSEGGERGGKRMEEESKDVKKSEEEQEPPTLCVQCLHYPVCVCV